MLNRYNTKATFFVLGSVAKEQPRLIQSIVSQGHEIASHGYSHKAIWELSRKSFKAEILETNKILEDLSQSKIIGFRAPFFSIKESTAWAIDVLKETGFKYDSSVFPMRTPIYGISNALNRPYYIDSKSLSESKLDNSLLEIPISVAQLGPLKFPFSGGIYARFLPNLFLEKICLNFAKENVLNFYFHPWEIGKQQIPNVRIGPINYILSHYNSNSYLDKIENIVQKIPFTSALSWMKDEKLF